MVSMENIRKFFDDHPEYALQRTQMVSQLDQSLDENGMIKGQFLIDILGRDIADQLDEEVNSNFDHALLLLKGFKKDN